MTLSVVILNYNVRYFLEHCLYSVQRATQGIDSEIIVVDNASTDDSLVMMKAQFPNIKLIVSPVNGGFSAGNNLGVAQAQGQYVCLLNPDTVVGEHCFSQALDKARSLPDLGILSVKMIDGTGNFLPESKRRVPYISSAFKKLIGLGKANGYYDNSLTEDGQGEVAVLVGAFMLFKKDRYLEIGGLDEAYFMYGEDIDLSYRFTKAGYPNYYLGSTAIIHYKGESTVKDSQYWNRFYGAMFIFYKKHISKAGWYLPLLKAGLWLLKQFAVINAGSRKQSETAIVQTYLLSEQLSLRDHFTRQGIDELKTLSKSRAFDGGIKRAMLIMDTSYIDYGQIIRLMQLLKNQENRFRIYPKGSSFILGSDYSDQKGEVISW